MAAKSFPIIVFVDPVDTDNILMCLQALQDFPDENIAIVLSPRPIDFRAQFYGDNFKSIAKIVGLEKAILPLEKDPLWANDLQPDIQAWFYRDLDFSNDEVKKDTELYMQLSALRFASALDKLDTPRKRYTFFLDERSIDENKIKPGVRHAIHVPDFAFDFDNNEKNKFVHANVKTGDVRRDSMLEVCQDYIKRLLKQFNLENSDSILHSYDDLLRANIKDNISPILLIGGPLTEAFRWICEHSALEIFAMGGYIHGNVNLFANQFNFHIDMDSAWKFLQLVLEKGISLWLLPTECAKGKPEMGIICPWELDEEELTDVFESAPVLFEQVRRFSKDTKTLSNINLFDWIAALMVKNRTLLPAKPVAPYLIYEGGKEILRFEQSSESCIRMFWNDFERMKTTKPDLIGAMKKTISRRSST
ncbi:hypothetical protein BX600DRAFT_526089 [Xylariales sp. PMI_506]|nr:hypothetical protein BX600DRAFT_515421 [Xylariales sp. PMI_506]KAH8655740.1 hypothetical protein BX600DRAFT_526089 [Xylariales sp. PMI_506]